MTKLSKPRSQIRFLLEEAHRLREENWQFCHELAVAARPPRISRSLLARMLTLAGRVDCRECANCCKRLTPVLTEGETHRLAAAASLSPSHFRRTYLRRATDFSGFVFRDKPCPFLKDNLCTAYALRPANCRTYPHLDRQSVIDNIVLAFQNTVVCPKVFLVVNGLRTASRAGGGEQECGKRGAGRTNRNRNGPVSPRGGR